LTPESAHSSAIGRSALLARASTDDLAALVRRELARDRRRAFDAPSDGA
jgi:hypothetical protein